MLSNILQRIREDDSLIQLLQDFSQLLFLSAEKALSDYGLHSENQFKVFAEDETGGLFGFLNSSVSDTNQVPVGFVSSVHTAGKVADTLEDFLSLSVYYPFWQGLLGLPENEFLKAAKAMGKELSGEYTEYLEEQKELADSLGLKPDKDLLKRTYNILGQKEHLWVREERAETYFDGLVE